MGVFLDPLRDFPVDQNLPEAVVSKGKRLVSDLITRWLIPHPPGHSLGPNVVHQHLVGRQLVLHGRPGVVGLFQPYPTAQLIEYLDPEAGLQMVGRVLFDDGVIGSVVDSRGVGGWVTFCYCPITRWGSGGYLIIIAGQIISSHGLLLFLSIRVLWLTSRSPVVKFPK